MKNKNRKVTDRNWMDILANWDDDLIIVEINPSGVFECKKCGQTWRPNIKPYSDARLYRESWQCPNGCKPKERAECKKMNIKEQQSLQGVDYPFKCAWEKCKAEMWHGERLYSIGNYKKKCFDYYCKEHYPSALEQEFLKLYKKWDGKNQTATDIFRNIFAIYVESLYDALPHALSKGKIESRTMLKKYRYGVEFLISRHKNAFKRPEKMYTTNQHWRFYIKSKKLKLIEEW